ncbi:HNH endonuclease [Phenylobacterium sp.]|uniref:HNH endonuclease n=1 Tax=Phenylobacterium sp. TaxID=1871053 RepID=UPI002F408B6F
MKGHWISYSAAEMAWLEANRLLPIGDYHRAFCEAFGRDVSAPNLHAPRKRRGWKTGRTGCFEKGSAPANKGKACAPGTGGSHPNARKTQFKKGGLPHNTKWAGHERVTVDGYIEISVKETNPYTGYERRYVLKHVWLWEAARGAVPDGYCLKALDSDRTNTDPANWELVPRALLPALNGGPHKRRPAYDGAALEMKPALLTLAKVEHRARQLRKRP